MKNIFLARFAATAAVLTAVVLGPASADAATVKIKLTDNVASIIAANPPGTTFILPAGTFHKQTLSDSGNMQNDIFLGAGGAGSSTQTIFDGQYAAGVAFCHNYFPGVQLQNMVIEHYPVVSDGQERYCLTQ